MRATELSTSSMVHSAISSEPLTSPTPSPPPNSPPAKPSSTASARATGFESGSELSELSEDEQLANGVNDNEVKTRSNRTRSRRKRGGVVPGDMWDWAYKTKKAAPEEHIILEQEQDNDEQDPEIDAQAEETNSHEPAAHEQERDIDNPVQGHAQKEECGLGPVENEEHDDEEEEGQDQEHDQYHERYLDEEHDDDEQQPVEDGMQVVPVPVPAGVAEGDQGKGEDDMEIDSSVENPEILPPVSPQSVSSDPPPPIPDGDGHSDTDLEHAGEDSASPPPHDDEDDDIASSRPDSPTTDIDIDDAPLAMSRPARSSSLATPMTVPVPVMHPEDGSPEPSPSPEPEDAPPEADQDVEQDDDVGENEDQELKGEVDGDLDAEPDGEAASPTPEPSSRSPTPEPDLLDLQPAHRAEALDALALIELKFALLRERLYVEKMEELVEEEGMVVNGTHPELLHLQLELSTRRDKRLELAARRRAFEESSVRVKRRDDQNGVWEWWKYERDTLQTDMVAYHNRKRRKLERQRRAHERPQPIRRVPPPPQPRTLPPAPPLAAVLDFEVRAPYSSAYPMRPARPSLALLSPAEVESDLGYITGGKRRFWAIDGPGGVLGGNDGLMGFANGSTSAIGEHSAREVKERERVHRPQPSLFEPTPGQHFRPLAINAFVGEEPGVNGWAKRRSEDEARSERERERERERDRERTAPRQSILPLHSHPHTHHTIQHQHPSHAHGLHSFSHPHPHPHPTHLHPHPHHHHVHVHHHHHTGPGSGPGPSAPPPPAGQPSRRAPEHSFPPNVHPNAGLAPEKPVFAHLSEEKLGQGGFWRRDDGDGMGREREQRDRDRDRDRELQRERERDKRASMDIMHAPGTSLHGHTSSGAMGYERIMPSPFLPASPRHQSQRHEPWDDTQPPRPSMGSPSRHPPPHALSHPSRQSSLGSPSARRTAPSSPPQPTASSHSHANSSSALGLFPGSPRSMPITPVPAGPGPLPPKSSTSRPLSPVLAKMVPGASGAYPQDIGGDGSRGPRGGDLFGPQGGSSSRADVYAENGSSQRRETHEARPVAMTLTGVGGGSTTESQYPRDRRDRPY